MSTHFSSDATLLTKSALIDFNCTQGSRDDNGILKERIPLFLAWFIFKSKFFIIFVILHGPYDFNININQ
jgi:hypothetical protein